MTFNFSIDVLKKAHGSVVKELVLMKTSWHHTSKHYNETDFYSINEDALSKLTNEKIQETVLSHKNEQSITIVSEQWKCEFYVWSGTRKRPKATKMTDVGEIRGNWFYLKDGTKKSIKGKGFKKIEKCE
jgi:hypothetical protein